ncbi:helix-turn-helix transcriptional regulator [Reyranella sp.]|uniref:helix-turn-helix domain-containing protein n=1 Tax=Reyranella sp. TaxID=1929291 RepID=UPI0025D27155|nr:helix-turn-helix transcriptional regulator [Reyranella sp.]
MGEALRLLRVFSDKTQKDMAEDLCVSQSFLSEVENGKKQPTLELLQRYSEQLKVPLSSLMFFAEEVDPLTKSGKAKIAIASKVLRFLSKIAPETNGKADR